MYFSVRDASYTSPWPHDLLAAVLEEGRGKYSSKTLTFT
jgi:hypothetical protein